jgi:hypothetical protein
MAKDMFGISAPDLINLRKFWKKSPKLFGRAVGLMLNEFGFGVRKKSLILLDKNMEIRNKRFVESKMRVDMAKGTQPIASQRAEVGSLFGNRFTGWEEQELGKAADRTRVPTLFARGNDAGKQVKPSMRMKPSAAFRSPADVQGKDAHHSAQILLIMTNRENFRKPFILFGHDDIEPGLYKWQKKGQLRLVQEFNSDKAQPKRFKWMSKAKDAFFAAANMTQLWSKVLSKVLKK